MSFANITHLIQADLSKVTQLIQDSCTSEVPLINNTILHLANNSGKLLRPTISILCANMAGVQNNAHINIAAAIEMLHTATLLHDDIVDNSALRRGKISANYKWGNDVAVLAGDFLLAKSAHTIAMLNNIAISQQLTQAMCTIAEGEILQLLHKNKLDTSEETYLKIITTKTATLFIAAATLPTIYNNCSPTIINNFTAYAKHLGIAFQLIDDLLDYQPPCDNTPRENIGADLLDGRISLPIIHLLKHGTTADKSLLQAVLTSKNLKLLPELRSAIARSGAIAYTIALAEQELAHASLAIADLIDSPHKAAALTLLDFIVSGNY